MNAEEEHRVLALVTARTAQARRRAIEELKRCRASDTFKSELQLAWSRVHQSEEVQLDPHPADRLLRRMDPGPEPLGLSPAVADWMRHWARADELRQGGATVPGPLLLHGPTGCGKTTTAAWLAGQFQRPSFVLDVHDVLRSHMGETGGKLASAFGSLTSGDLLVLEEVDGLAWYRDAEHGSAGREYASVTIAFMRLMDGAAFPIVATTNRLDTLDAAVVRRFDAVVEVVDPGIEIREQIVERLAGEPVELHNGALAIMSMSEVVRRAKLHRRLAVLGEDTKRAWA